jgi:cytochrome c oxidase subunit III
LSTKSTALWDHYENLEQQHDANVLGMWVFLSTELLLFGVLFAGYTIYRIQFSPAFDAASSRLNWQIAGVNTIVLLTSSLTMALAVRAAQFGRRQTLVWLLVATAVLGAAFLGFKAVEYYGDYRENLVPGLAFDAEEWHQPSVEPNAVKLFLVFYYVMTGLHAVHLTVAIGILTVLAIAAHRGVFTAESYTPVETWGLYWHFVDLVWIFLLPLLYLIGTHTWGGGK